MKTTAAHPAQDRLTAFSLGKLGDEDAAQVADHVGACTVCQVVVETQPDDALVALVRRAVCQQQYPSTRIDSWVPPELVSHPRYRLQEWLGAGGMGVVYKAEHCLMERTVALKVVSKSLTASRTAVERFKKEVKAAARLSHPNIVTAYDAEQAGDLHFLVMEFVEGTSLARLVEDKGPLPVETACDYVRQAALGLQHAFEAGMVHRDIKPQNLMLTPKGEVKILDFGLAGFVGERKTQGTLTEFGQGLGTPDYMAPEQIRDAHAADIRADIYSLGCTLYFLLTRHPPFPEGSVLQKITAHLEKNPKPVRDLRCDVPEGVARVVERMMMKEPDQRYQTPRELAEALGSLTQQKGRKRRMVPWVIVIGLLIVVVVLGVIIKVRTKTGTYSIEVNQEYANGKEIIKIQLEQDAQKEQATDTRKKAKQDPPINRDEDIGAKTSLIIIQSKTWSWPGSRWNYANYNDGTFEVGMGNDYTGDGDVGVEIEKASKLKVTVESSPVFKRYDGDSFAGFMVDYHTPKGYVLRVALSMDFSSPTRKVKTPIWGKRSIPDRYVNIRKKKEYILDLNEWAPVDWDGKVWFTLTLQNSGYNTWMRAKLSPNS